jgi:hypothetical protein
MMVRLPCSTKHRHTHFLRGPMKVIATTAALFFASFLSLPAQTPAAPAAPAAAVTATPNLSGTWKLNLEKSDFDQVPPPSSQIDIFTQTGNNLTIATTSNGERGKEVYALPMTIGGDATATPKDIFPDAAEFQILSSKAAWQGATLVVDQRMIYQGSVGTIHSLFTLSPDGKSLTRLTHYSLNLGDFDTKTIFDKQ